MTAAHCVQMDARNGGGRIEHQAPAARQAQMEIASKEEKWAKRRRKVRDQSDVQPF